MKILKRSLAGAALAGIIAVMLGSAACNTVKGVGRDIERGGEKTQDAADAVRRRL